MRIVPFPRPSLPIAALLASFVWSAPVMAQDGAHTEEEEDEIIVQATRTGRRVQDEPIRVEVIGREEIEEKIMMTPGNISMLVAETGGVRVQVTSPALGASTVRIQGLKGRYTSLQADGLPLYGGQASSIGLLQIAPTDLAQVEVIKGSASALYGPSALGGVINLVSRRPGEAPEGEILINVTSREGADLTGYGAMLIGDTLGVSLTGGLHRQLRQDADVDGWSDIPGHRRWTARPRLFWSGGDGSRVYLTMGAMGEERRGGTEPGRTVPDGTPFPEAQDTLRLDGGLVAEMPLSGIGTLHLRASATRVEHDHLYGTVLEKDRHGTNFAELSLAGGSERTSWLGGFAIQSDGYRSRAFPVFNYRHTVPGAFAQLEHEASEGLIFAGSARIDFHSEYGTRLSPRVSLLYKPGRWTIRAALGGGFYAPTPFVEETEATGLSRLAPLAGLRAETANSASLDIGYRFGRLETNIALFASRLRGAVRVEETGIVGGPAVRLVNVDEPVRTRGAEILLRYRWKGFTLTGSYVHVDTTEPDPVSPGRRVVPLTPHSTAGMVAMWEKPGRARIGVEAYYTGTQLLEDNPYRARSRPYVEMGMLGEITFGKTSFFINAENILNVRQSRWDPIVRPQRAADGRWTVDAWAPLDGFTLNGGVRIRFGGD